MSLTAVKGRIRYGTPETEPWRSSLNQRPPFNGYFWPYVSISKRDGLLQASCFQLTGTREGMRVWIAIKMMRIQLLLVRFLKWNESYFIQFWNFSDRNFKTESSLSFLLFGNKKEIFPWRFMTVQIYLYDWKSYVKRWYGLIAYFSKWISFYAISILINRKCMKSQKLKKRTQTRKLYKILKIVTLFWTVWNTLNEYWDCVLLKKTFLIEFGGYMVWFIGDVGLRNITVFEIRLLNEPR